MTEYDANVVVHIDETLTAHEIHEIEKGLSGYNGIISACVHEKTPHLMVVDYDPNTVTSATLLSFVAGNGVHAELVGGF